MYLPSYFEETRVDALHELMRERPLATLVTLAAEGLVANHIPLEIDPEPAPFGTLIGHVARANPVWRDFSPDVLALAVFQGPQAYVSPSWLATKTETGKVVPTWNYVVVHAHGPLRVIDDVAWLRAFVERLTNRHEATRPQPWKVADAPAEYVETQLRAIVGIEIPVQKLVGKWKASQNRTEADREGIRQALAQAHDADGSAMARVMSPAASRDRHDPK